MSGHRAAVCGESVLIARPRKAATAGQGDRDAAKVLGERVSLASVGLGRVKGGWKGGGSGEREEEAGMAMG